MARIDFSCLFLLKGEDDSPGFVSDCIRSVWVLIAEENLVRPINSNERTNIAMMNTIKTVFKRMNCFEPSGNGV